MATPTGGEFNCKSCGALVIWARSKNDKKYLAQPETWQGDRYGAIRTFLPSHQCNPNPDYQNIVAQLKAKDLESGKIMKDQEIIVVAGRKVPKGTTGIVFWVNETHDYDGSLIIYRVGFKDAEGTTYFTAAKNVVATNQQEAK